MRYFAPAYMDHPESTDKETFLALMLKRRPEYVIVWDVTGKDLLEFQSRVWVVQYVAIRGDNVYFSQSRHYAKRAKVLFNLQNVIEITAPDQWEKLMPEEPAFKRIKYYAPGMVEQPTDIDLEDFINKMLNVRPPYAVLWGVTFEDVINISSRVYVVSYMPVINDTIYYSYGKQYVADAAKRFNIAKREKINIQNPFGNIE
jgi:hypothetical protein